MTIEEIEILKYNLIKIIKIHPEYHKCWDQLLYDTILASTDVELRNSEKITWKNISKKIKNQVNNNYFKIIRYGRVGEGEILRIELSINNVNKFIIIRKNKFPSKNKLINLSKIIRYHENNIWELLVNLNNVNVVTKTAAQIIEKHNDDYNAKFRILKKFVDKIRVDYKKEKNISATDFLETTIGAGIWYLGDNCSGIISLEVLKDIIIRKSTLTKAATADHIFPRKNVGARIMKNVFEFEKMKKEYQCSWSQVAYVTKNDNQKTKSENKKTKQESEFSIRGQSNFKKIKRHYINFFKLIKKPLIDTGFEDKTEFDSFLNYLKIKVKNPKDLIPSKIKTQLKAYNKELYIFKKEYF